MGELGGGVHLAEAYGPETLRTLQSVGAAHGASLAAALTYDDKRVRYAAAEALLRLAPTKRFANWDNVWEGLAGALGESGSRVILVAAHDQQVRNRMTGIVRELNHLPFTMTTGKEAVLRARTSGAQDAIIVHSEFSAGDFSTAELLTEIQKDYRTRGLPVIIVAPKLMVRKKAEQFPQAAAVLPDDVDPVILKDKLESLWSGAYARPNDPKRKAIDVARQAAVAIAESDPRTSIFDLDNTVPALLDAIEYQPDEVRVPALRALGVLSTARATDKAAIIFDNSRNSRAVRIAAAFCVGESLRNRAMPSKIFEALLRAMESGDQRLYKACGEALGKASLSRDQILKLYEQQRID